MDMDLALPLVTAAIWLSAGIVADGIPQLTTARELRRRTGWLLGLTVTGLAVLATVGIGALVTAEPTIVDRAAAGLALCAAPAAIVAALTVRRLRRLWAGAGAFAAAPDTPAPPALVAGAAHPMVALPVQVTGLATLPATAIATGLVPIAAPGTVGLALTAAVLVVITMGVRHALRHSRLAESAVTLRPASSQAARIQHV
jgi:hypothetical protein